MSEYRPHELLSKQHQQPQPNQYQKPTAVGSLSLSHEINQLKKTNQELIDTLSAEVDLYKADHIQFCNAIQNQTNSSWNTCNPNTPPINPDEVCLKHKQITDQAIANLNEQLHHLTKERDSMRILWKTSEKTCVNLEKELAEYKRLCNGSDAIGKLRKDLEAVNSAHLMTIADMQKQLECQKQCNAKLSESKAQLVQNLAAIESKYKDFIAEQTQVSKRVANNESTLVAAKSHIADVLRQRNELEKRLAQSNTALNEHMARETKALEKVQEVLMLAENAIAEKNAAIQRELETKEECDHLATTIGQVMEEAANKCEEDMEQRQNRFKETIKTLENHIAQQSHMLETQTKKTEQAEARVAKILESNRTLLTQISTLDTELEQASRTIIEMEIKIDELNRLLDNEKEVNRLNEARCAELTDYLAQHRKLKHSWKSTVEDITDKYQEAVDENDVLRDQIRRLNVKVSQYPMHDLKYGDGNNVIVLSTRQT